MTQTTDKDKGSISVSDMVKKLAHRKKKFFLVWLVTFAVSCLWVLPQPRYYTCTVKLAPEGIDMASGYAAIASSLGFGTMGGGLTADAIYPTLYPTLFDSPEFMVGLFGVHIETADGSISESYYDYLKKHQKKNWLTAPFVKAKKFVTSMFEEKETVNVGQGQAKDPFRLSVRDMKLMQKMQSRMTCATDTRTSVVTITVTDQDRMVCALMADSVRAHLQSFIIGYRTQKARNDMEYFAHVADSARMEYENAQEEYARFNESHHDVSSPVYVAKGDKLKNEMDLKLNAYNTLKAQYEVSRAKLQEKTPSFTTLVGATVPIKPAGPKRMLFVAFMLVLSTVVYGTVVLKSDLGKVVTFLNRK